MRRHRNVLCTLLILVPVIAAGVSACSSTNVTSGPTAAKCQVTVGTLGSIVASGGIANVMVTAPQECGWDATTQATWITGLAPASGQGSANLEFQVAPNPAPTVREADVLINQEKVHVAQEAAACVYTLVPNNLTMPAAGGPGTININTLAGCSWNAVSDVAWVTITGAASGTGNGAIRFSAASNGGVLRVGTVTIAGEVATINQSAPVTPAPGPTPSPNPNPNPNPNPSPSPSPTPAPCTYSITPTNYAAGVGGGPGPTVNVTAGSACQWTAASNDSWITLTGGAIGTGNGTVGFSVASNPYNVRMGSLTIAGQTLSVQQATSCVFTLDRSSISFPTSPGNGVTRPVNVTTTGPLCNWTATTPDSWITIVTGGSYSGDAQLRVSASANNTGAPRTGTLIIAGQTVTVSQ
jgi:hypothetical protein